MNSGCVSDCFVLSVCMNMGVRMKVRMPVGSTSSALPDSLSNVSVFHKLNIPFPSLHWHAGITLELLVRNPELRLGFGSGQSHIRTTPALPLFGGGAKARKTTQKTTNFYPFRKPQKL